MAERGRCYLVANFYSLAFMLLLLSEAFCQLFSIKSATKLEPGMRHYCRVYKHVHSNFLLNKKAQTMSFYCAQKRRQKKIATQYNLMTQNVAITTVFARAPNHRRLRNGYIDKVNKFYYHLCRQQFQSFPSDFVWGNEPRLASDMFCLRICHKTSEQRFNQKFPSRSSKFSMTTRLNSDLSISYHYFMLVDAFRRFLPEKKPFCQKVRLETGATCSKVIKIIIFLEQPRVSRRRSKKKPFNQAKSLQLCKI